MSSRQKSRGERKAPDENLRIGGERTEEEKDAGRERQDGRRKTSEQKTKKVEENLKGEGREGIEEGKDTINQRKTEGEKEENGTGSERVEERGRYQRKA